MARRRGRPRSFSRKLGDTVLGLFFLAVLIQLIKGDSSAAKQPTPAEVESKMEQLLIGWNELLSRDAVYTSLTRELIAAEDSRNEDAYVKAYFDSRERKHQLWERYKSTHQLYDFDSWGIPAWLPDVAVRAIARDEYETVTSSSGAIGGRK